MLLKPTGISDLEHRAYFLRGVAGRSAIVAASEDGHATAFRPDFTPLLRQRLARKLNGVSPHPSEPLLAWADEEKGALVVQLLGGERLAEFRPPQVRTSASHGTKQGFDDCFFDEGGKFFWAIGRTSDGDIELQLIDATDWTIAQKTVVEDQFGGSFCSLHGTGRPDVISLWVAAGQDGQQVYWLKRQGSKFSCEPAEELANTVYPVFSPEGSTFLVVNENYAICKFDFATMKQIGGPLLSEEDEDNPFAESLCYLDHRHALASTVEQRVFLVDTDQMMTVEEVEIEGHEPRPVGEYYPSLANEPGLSTDIAWFTRLGNAIVFNYRRDRGTGLKGWKDSLLWYLVK